MPQPEGVYRSTKFAVEGLTEAMSEEVATPRGKVVLIERRPFRTDFAGSGSFTHSDAPRAFWLVAGRSDEGSGYDMRHD
jgi:short-subunit dehydrogenase